MPKQQPLDDLEEMESRHARIEDVMPRPESPAQLTVSRLTLRIWRFPETTSSFVAGSLEAGGLSERMTSTIPFEVERTTLARLRVPIEVQNGRRTSLFQELLTVMAALPNPHRWPSQLTYRFGVWDDESTTPTVITNEDDLVSTWITKPLEQDLILIPQSQIDDRDVCTLVNAADGAPRRSPRCP